MEKKNLGSSTILFHPTVPANCDLAQHGKAQNMPTPGKQAVKNTTGQELEHIVTESGCFKTKNLLIQLQNSVGGGAEFWYDHPKPTTHKHLLELE